MIIGLIMNMKSKFNSRKMFVLFVNNDTLKIPSLQIISAAP